MLQKDTPEDYVIATGEQHSVRDFVERAFKTVKIIIGWKGEGVEEVGYDMDTNQVLVEIDPKYYRPTEVDTLLGDPSKAKAKLGWNPNETSFEELVEIMVNHDLKFVENESILKQSYE